MTDDADPAGAAETFLAEAQEHSLAADIIGRDLDEEKEVTVYVLDLETEEIVSVLVRLSAEVTYHAQGEHPKPVTTPPAASAAPGGTS